VTLILYIRITYPEVHKSILTGRNMRVLPAENSMIPDQFYVQTVLPGPSPLVDLKIPLLLRFFGAFP
jgi:hypothetical protein